MPTVERQHLDLAAIGAADSWSSATPSSSSPAVGSRATEHRAGMGLHPQRGDQLAARFAIERRNSELAKHAEPGCLAEVYRKIVEMDGSSQRRRPVSGLDEVLTIVAIKIAPFAIAALFSRPGEIGGLFTSAGWVILAVSELQRSRIIVPITKSFTG